MVIGTILVILVVFILSIIFSTNINTNNFSSDIPDQSEFHVTFSSDSTISRSEDTESLVTTKNYPIMLSDFYDFTHTSTPSICISSDSIYTDDSCITINTDSEYNIDSITINPYSEYGMTLDTTPRYSTEMIEYSEAMTTDLEYDIFKDLREKQNTEDYRPMSQKIDIWRSNMINNVSNMVEAPIKAPTNVINGNRLRIIGDNREVPIEISTKLKCKDYKTKMRWQYEKGDEHVAYYELINVKGKWSEIKNGIAKMLHNGEQEVYDYTATYDPISQILRIILVDNKREEVKLSGHIIIEITVCGGFYVLTEKTADKSSGGWPISENSLTGKYMCR